MTYSKNKIFTNYYIKKNNQISNLLRYEQLEELMYNQKLTGNEKVSEDKINWVNIKKILPMLDSFLSSNKKEIFNEKFLNQISQNSIYKIKTNFNVTMGPFDNKKLLSLIEQEKIEDEYLIISEDISIDFASIKIRLYEKIRKIINESEKKNDFDSDFDKTENFLIIDIDVDKEEIEDIPEENNTNGLLSTKPLLYLIFVYSIEKSTGILQIKRKNDIYELSFKKGKLAYLLTNKEELSISTFLKLEKNIQIEFNSSLNDSEIISKMIAENKINSSEIYYFLKKLISFRLKEVFNITNGKFLFKNDAVTDDTNLNIDILSQIWNFTSNFTSSKIINKYVESIQDYIILKDERRFKYKDFLKLGPTELKLLNKINNKFTPKKFIEALENQKKELVETFKILIYILYHLKFIKKGDKIDIKDIQGEIISLKKKIKEIEEKNNHFFTLGISEDTSLEQIRKQYIKASKNYHPDILSKEENSELKKLKVDYYTHISTAYQEISTQEKLNEYLQVIKNGGKKEFNSDNLFKSEEFFNKCKKAINAGKYEKALEYINNAINLFKENPEYEIHRLYLEFILNWQSDLRKANGFLNKLKQEMENNDSYSEGYRFLGRIYKALKDKEQSKNYFSILLKLIPYDSEANREVR